MNGFKLFLAAAAVFCLADGASAAPSTDVKMLDKTAQETKGTAVLPWVMAKDDNDMNHGPIAVYIKNLGKEEEKAVRELDKQLRARVEEDRKIIAANGAGKTEAENEIRRYENFLFALGDPIRMDFNGKIDLDKQQAQFISFQIRTGNSSTKVMSSKKDGKFYFFGDNGEPEFIRDNDVVYIKEAIRRMYYINIFCLNQTDKDYQKTQCAAALCCMKGQEALKNNSSNVVTFHPLPDKGTLHNELAKDALACALKQYSNAVDVVISDSDWSIVRNGLGIIICRVCSGWIIVKDDIGKLAIPAKWSQPNQGGSTYGKLQLYNYGSNKRFYVK